MDAQTKHMETTRNKATKSNETALVTLTIARRPHETNEPKHLTALVALAAAWRPHEHKIPVRYTDPYEGMENEHGSSMEAKQMSPIK